MQNKVFLLAVAAIVVIVFVIGLVFFTKDSGEDDLVSAPSATAQPATTQQNAPQGPSPLITIANDVENRAVNIAVAESAQGAVWQSRCDRDEQGRNIYCEVFHSLVLAQNNQRLLEIGVGYPPLAEGQEGNPVARATIFLPLGILIGPGLSLKIDDIPAQTLPLLACDAVACRVNLSLEPAFMARFTSATEATFSFQDVQEETVNITLDMSGFEKAMNDLPAIGN
jgi:invasion protein IalB